MKKSLFFVFTIALGLRLNVYADGYQSYKIACELYKAGHYEEAKQRLMICLKYYPDDDLNWSKIYQCVKECDAQIKNEAIRQGEKAALIAKASEEERRKYEERQRLRKERKLIYVSVNASTLDGEYPDFKRDIVGALAPYGYRTTNNKEDAYWSIYVSADVAKFSKSGTVDPSHIVQINAHYTIQNDVDGYIPAGGEGGCDAKGYSGIDYNRSVYNAYANLKGPLGEAFHKAIENIVETSEPELENIIAVVVSGDGLPANIRLQPAVDIFMRALQRYSDYEVVDRTAKVISEGRWLLLKYGEQWSSSSSMLDAIGNDIHPRYICSIEIIYRPIEQDYYLSAHITDIKTSGSKGTSFYPLDATQTPIKVLDSNQMHIAALYIVKDLHESVAIMSDTKFNTLLKDIQKIIDDCKRNRKQRFKANITAAGASLAVPGLGLVLKGHNEGYAYLGAEAALCLGGVMVPELMRKHYINKRNHESNANNRDVYTNRANSCRKVSIICGACAGVLHVVNIVHSFVAEPDINKNPKLQWEIKAMPLESNIRNDYAMGLSLTYRF